MIINVKATVKLPHLPNYLLLPDDEHQKIDVADLSDEDIRRIGEAWTAALIAHSMKRRMERKDP